MTARTWPNIILRIGVAFAFLYPPYAALGDPISWFSYFPAFIQALPIPHDVILHGFGLLEAVIAVWILSGKRIFIPSALATLMLVAIVAFNLSLFDIVFRDLAIACMSASLALGAWRPRAGGISSPA
ncbi:MAG TPA: hypothetical protein VF439_01435 [Candidatus Paceibacterota bacterium]